VATLQPGGSDIGVAGIDPFELAPRSHVKLQRVASGCIGGGADGPWTEASPRSEARPVIERSTHDGHVRSSCGKFGWISHERPLAERHAADITRLTRTLEGRVLAIPAVQRGEIP